MQTFAINLEQLIIDTRNHYQQYGVTSGLSEETLLEEFRIIRVSTPRQTGNTERIVRCFNPEHSVYVGPNEAMVNRFKQRLSLNNEFPAIYLNSSNFAIGVEPLRGKSIETIFFDLGMRRQIQPTSIARVRKLIKMIEEVVTTKPIYVIS